mmetsp:Transcript_24464/g.36642  ORF Transcript_24464/g.36642 Transcript_24464/m.36642 type:complete len:359 (-) Transcript_24464:807-1883(-)
MVWCLHSYGVAILIVMLLQLSKAMYNFSTLGGTPLPEGIMTSRSENANSTDSGSEVALTVSVSVDLIHVPTVMDEESLDVFVKEITLFLYERFQLTIPMITVCGDVTITDQVLRSSEYSSLYLIRVSIDICGSPSLSNFDERVRNMINAQGSALVRSLRSAGDDYFHDLQSLEAVDADEIDTMKEDGDKTEHQFDWIIVLCAVGASFAVIGVGVSVAGLLRRKRNYMRQNARQNEIKRGRNLKQRKSRSLSPERHRRQRTSRKRSRSLDVKVRSNRRRSRSFEARRDKVSPKTGLTYIMSADGDGLEVQRFHQPPVRALRVPTRRQPTAGVRPGDGIETVLVKNSHKARPTHRNHFEV